MINNIIGPDSSVKGEFEIHGNLRIDGQFHGTITGSSSVLVGENGNVDFQLKGKDIIIGGKVSGKLHLTGKVFVLSTGSLCGEVSARSIEIEPGGTIMGRCKIHKEEIDHVGHFN